MRVNEDTLAEAARRSVDTEHRAGVWEVWPKYEARRDKGGGSFILRVEPDEADLGPRVDLAEVLERTNGRVSPSSPEEKAVRDAVARDEARRESYPYRPLVREPHLFLKFARLADGGGLDDARTKEDLDTEKNLTVANDWAHTYGVLGLTLVEKDGHLGASTIGGVRETVAAFAREAWVANGCLKLYEAATADNLDIDLVASYIPAARWRAFYTQTPAMAREFALDQVATQTQQRLAGNVYPALYGEIGRFVRGWDFTNLLGAMWLQMYWLLTAQETPRRCKECDRIIAYEQPDFGVRGTRSDRRFCEIDENGKRDGCKNRYNYRTRTKPRRHQKG